MSILRPRIRPARRGFTLLEVLFAVALGASLMVAAITFLLSMGELWGRGSDKRLFDQHVRGVTRFLESFLQQANVPTDATQQAAAGTGTGNNNPPQNNGGGAQNPRTGAGTGATAQTGATSQTGTDAETQGAASKDRFSFGNPHGYEGDPMLMFEVDEAPGVCVWPVRPLPKVECAVQITPSEGLVLLWISKLEDDYGTVRPRKTQISPYVQAAEFEYFDEQRGTWERQSAPIKDPGNVVRMPQRFRLTFVYGGETRQVSIAVPAPPGGPPLR